jgi:hypothetical protein
MGVPARSVAPRAVCSYRLTSILRFVALCEHTFVREYRYTVVEHDAERPWIVVGEIRRLTVELEDDVSFFDWAPEHWPSPRYHVVPDPWQTSPTGP